MCTIDEMKNKQTQIQNDIFSIDSGVGVIADGITDIQSYLNCNKKVTIANKEANEPGGGDYAMTDIWKKDNLESKTQFFSEFIAAILQGKIIDTSFENRQKYWNGTEYAIGSSNYINISKSVAGSTTDDQELIEKSYVWEDIIQRQLENAKSDIIYCGGEIVWQILKRILRIPDTIKNIYDGKSTLINGIFKTNQTLYISGCHPSYLHYKSNEQELFFSELARIRDTY